MIKDEGNEKALARLLACGAVDIEGIWEAACRRAAGSSPGVCQGLVDLGYARTGDFLEPRRAAGRETFALGRATVTVEPADPADGAAAPPGEGQMAEERFEE